MPKLDRADISQAALDRLVDVFIDFVRENIELQKEEPFAWCWYDFSNERYEFCLRKEDAHSGATPLYRRVAV